MAKEFAMKGKRYSVEASGRSGPRCGDFGSSRGSTHNELISTAILSSHCRHHPVNDLEMRDYGVIAISREKLSGSQDDLELVRPAPRDGAEPNPQSDRANNWSRRSDSNGRPAHYE